jgi:hypothetical protein
MGNDAIGAIRIAAVLNFQESTGVAMKRMKRDLRKEPLFLNIAHLHPWKSTFLNRGKIIRDTALFSVTHHVVDAFHL